MNKKVVSTLRILLYILAIYVLADMFFFSESKAVSDDNQLMVFTKQNNIQYTEFFVNYISDDSTWVVLQTNPAIGKSIPISKESPWRNPEKFESDMKSLKMTFVGFYLNPEMLLTRGSFFILSKQLDQLKENDDSRLSALTDRKSFTAVFVRN